MKIIKEQIKKQAQEIRELKQIVKDKMQQNEYCWMEYDELNKNKFYFRYNHVAYSILKGREYSQIENRVREGNEIDMDRVNKTIEEMKTMMEESENA